MSISLSNLSVAAGVTCSGLTTPTYTITADVAPSLTSKQWQVTGIGGTQSGVAAHTIASPKTITFFRPATFKAAPGINPVTGVFRGTVPFNEHRFLVRCGALPAANQLPIVNSVDVRMRIGAGTESYDSNNVAAMLQIAKESFNQQIDNLLTMIKTGSL